MCLPLIPALAIASVVTSAASAAFSVVGQQQKQASEIAYQDRLSDANARHMQENRDLATKAYLDQANEANRQLAETREAAAASNLDKSREAEEARGSALVSAAESGVSGISLDALLADFHRQEAMFKQRNDQNLLFKQQSTASNIRGYESEAKARISQVKPYQPNPVAPVDYIGPALSVAKSGMDTFINFKTGAKAGSKT